MYLVDTYMFLFCIALSINRNSNQWFLYPCCWLCTQLLIHVTWSVCACVSIVCELMCHLFSLLLHVFTVQDGRCEFVNHHYTSCLWMSLPLTGVFLFVVHLGIVELMDKSIQCTSLSQSTAIMNGVVSTLKATERLSERLPSFKPLVDLLWKTVGQKMSTSVESGDEKVYFFIFLSGCFLVLSLFFYGIPSVYHLSPSPSLPFFLFLSFSVLSCLTHSLLSSLSVLHICFLLRYHYPVRVCTAGLSVWFCPYVYLPCACMRSRVKRLVPSVCTCIFICVYIYIYICIG